ncbi:UDP-4-amino-4,6-dideoxy-N-acetyl-beta-L-altrosamine N-acetyltransferase [Pelotomaculum propionicicum]|uniref:UDP-4-amino-4, 6-dideoxy-N-acetyl-beta-L-altrosamine N-acetyltransferase n=1 Tax=Pelotomaculum propionicicum TaxID=258475 RepID=UPI003B7FBD52
MPGRENYSLRSLVEADLAKVLVWRNSERIRASMYTDRIITMDEHRQWFKKTSKDENTICMIFQYQENPSGLVNFTQIDKCNSRCHWGFYLGETDVPRGSGMAMGYLALEYIFEVIGIHKLYGEALAFNLQSIKYHKKLGFVEEGRFVEHIFKNGRYEDIISMAILNKNWLKLKSRLEEHCFGSGEKL